MERVHTHMPTGTHTLENGKKINTMDETINANAMERVHTHMPTAIHTLENGKKVYDMGKELLRMQTEKLKKVFGKKIN